jgi:hypothetical protein
MLGDGLGAAEGDDLGSLAGVDGQEGAGDDGEAFGRVVGGDVFGGCCGRNFPIFAHIEGGEDAGQTGQFEGGFCIKLLFIFNDLKWPLEGVGKVGRRVGEGAGGGEGQPRRPRNDDGPLTVPGFALVGQFQRRRARSGEEDIRRAIGIERREPGIIRGLDGKQMQRPDRDRPATAQRINRAGS